MPSNILYIPGQWLKKKKKNPTQLQSAIQKEYFCKEKDVKM